jgi:hypothetical protein
MANERFEGDLVPEISGPVSGKYTYKKDFCRAVDSKKEFLSVDGIRKRMAA